MPSLKVVVYANANNAIRTYILAVLSTIPLSHLLHKERDDRSIEALNFFVYAILFSCIFIPLSPITFFSVIHLKYTFSSFLLCYQCIRFLCKFILFSIITHYSIAQYFRFSMFLVVSVIFCSDFSSFTLCSRRLLLQL